MCYSRHLLGPKSSISKHNKLTLTKHSADRFELMELHYGARSNPIISIWSSLPYPQAPFYDTNQMIHKDLKIPFEKDRSGQAFLNFPSPWHPNPQLNCRQRILKKSHYEKCITFLFHRVLIEMNSQWPQHHTSQIKFENQIKESINKAS